MHKVFLEYENKVGDMLERTGHPRRREVLADLRQHLHEAAGEAEAPSMDELIERLGSPEEFAENIAPATGYRAKPVLQRRSFRIAVASLALICIIAAVAFNQRHELTARYRKMMDRNFYSQPFFDLEKMRGLKQGATPQEIRDAIGYPIMRFRYNEYEAVWNYTEPPSPDSPYYTVARVIVDLKESTLIRTEIQDAEEAHPPDTTERAPSSVKLKRITFSRPEKTVELDSSSPGVHVIIVGSLVGSTAAPIDPKLRRGEDFVMKNWKGVSRDQINLIHVLAPRALINWAEVPPESPVYAELKAANIPHSLDRRFAIADDDVWIYSKGILYECPPPYSGEDWFEQAFAEDQNWLVHKLLSE